MEALKNQIKKKLQKQSKTFYLFRTIYRKVRKAFSLLALIKKYELLEDKISSIYQMEIDDFFEKQPTSDLFSLKEFLSAFNTKINILVSDRYFQKTKKSTLFRADFLSTKYLDNFYKADFYLANNIRPTIDNYKIVKFAAKLNKEVILIEQSFISSVVTWADSVYPPKWRTQVGVMINNGGMYYEANRVTGLEKLLNSESTLSASQINRASKLIEKVISNFISKYNHQPIFKPQIGRHGVKKILVVDQSRGDLAVTRGGANSHTFSKMLDSAISENPEADIIIKTHPDTLTGNAGCYFSTIKASKNVYLYCEAINPISLINYVDKVYVVSSLMGFEALMCGKDVVTFGIPFYSGWGLTDDRKLCQRRNKLRSVEDIFYFAYIQLSYYYNPQLKKKIEIEEAVDFLIEKRGEFFQEYAIRNDLQINVSG